MAKKDGGFTLVEISIVMIIIGLLIGAVLKGQELVMNSKIKSDIASFNQIETALLTFYDSYRQLPGDIRNPGNILPNCGGATTCGQAFPNQGNGSIDFPCNGTDFFLSEDRQFFSQLAAADLYTHVQQNPPGPLLTPGVAIPKSQLGSGMIVLYTGTPRNPGGCSNASTTYGFNEPSGFRNFASSAAGNYGHYIVLGIDENFAFNVDPLGVSPRYVQKFDQTFDDGLPYSGRVQVGNLNGLCARTYPTNQYTPNNGGGECETLIKLNTPNQSGR